MPRLAKPLTDIEVRKAKAGAKIYRKADGNGLYLSVSPAGRKSWLVRYKLAGDSTHRPVTIGHYPAMSLAEARKKAAEIQQDAARNIETAGVRKARQLAKNTIRAEEKQQAQIHQAAHRATFSSVANRWLADRQPGWSPETYRKARYVLDSHLVPKLGHKDMRQLTTRDVRPALRTIWKQTPATANKARQYVAGIVDQAIDEGLRPDDSTLRLSRIFPTSQKGHMPALTDDGRKLQGVMKAIDAYPNRVTRAALLLMIITAVRPGMAASAEWAEMDLETHLWSIPAHKMKMRKPFTTPLPTQAVSVLKEMRRLRDIYPDSPCRAYVFPSQARQKTLHLHRDSLSKALRDMSFQGKQSPHGFRATFRSMAREHLDADVDVLEAQLAHGPKDEVAAAYARSHFRKQRKELMQRWADYLDSWRS